ncbi:MAG: aminotransferase class I/II-fold pyridoxal phosphate-dependent enzyme [Gammaproteobacteria bacterium]|nr:aminotransferase class I/II-fold pyridoxal phosphate-dependent enzyme [Gammaproteobacteria bacterium]
MAQISPFQVMELLTQAQQLEQNGQEIVHMEVGEPDFPTPAPIVHAGQQALAEGNTRYTPALGLPQLREAIAAFHYDYHQTNISPERVIITSGASAGLLLALGVTLSPAERMIMSDPGYPCNRNFVRFLGGEVDSIAVGADQHYQLSADAVRQQWQEQTRGVMVASPANPCGTLLPFDELKKIEKEVAARDGTLIVDEIYNGLSYSDSGHPPATALTLNSDHIITIHSFSKQFCMTGWRLGWMVVPAALVREVEKLAQNLYISPSTPAQYAALAAFSTETLTILEQYRQQFRQRRDFLLPQLRQLDFQIPITPEGAFYLYANSEKWGDDSRRLSQRLLHEAGVAVTPGSDFGSYRHRSHLRFAYTTSLEQLELGVTRLKQFREKL